MQLTVCSHNSLAMKRLEVDTMLTLLCSSRDAVGVPATWSGKGPATGRQTIALLAGSI
jgi:hypothetical protein